MRVDVLEQMDVNIYSEQSLSFGCASEHLAVAVMQYKRVISSASASYEASLPDAFKLCFVRFRSFKVGCEVPP
jgi:hypothetical protein